MTEKQPNQQQYPQNYLPYDDEINLIDYLKVLWKWKWMIIGGTLICAIVAAVISFQMPKIYSIDMVLKPGIFGVKKGNKFFEIDSADNLKTLIESGVFDNNILESNKNFSSKNISELLNFKVTVPKGTKNLKISYETSDVEVGRNILKSLGSLLLARYNSLVHSYMNERKAEIDTFNTYEENIKYAKKRIKELESEIDLLIKKRDRFCLTEGEKNILLTVLYDNTIQQKMTLANTYWLELNQTLANTYWLELNQWFAKKENSKYKLLKFDESKIHKIQTIPPPVSNPHLIKPKKKQIIILSVIVGFFFFIFLAFFIEYIKNASKPSSGDKEG